jgi:hypothetical protein
MRIHKRRRPKRSDENVSTNGPAIHLNAHGRYSEPTNAPISTGPEALPAHLGGDCRGGKAERNTLGDVEQKERRQPSFFSGEQVGKWKAHERNASTSRGLSLL